MAVDVDLVYMYMDVIETFQFSSLLLLCIINTCTCNCIKIRCIYVIIYYITNKILYEYTPIFQPTINYSMSRIIYQLIITTIIIVGRYTLV